MKRELVIGAVLISAIVFLVYMLVIQRYEYREEFKRRQKAEGELVNVNALKDSLYLYSKSASGKIDSLSGKIYESTLRLVSAETVEKLANDSLKRYKKLLGFARIELSYRGRDTVIAYYTDTINKLLVTPCDTLGYMRVPKPIFYSANGLTFAGKVTKQGAEIYNPHISLGEMTMGIGWKRKGFLGLGRAEPTFDIGTSPYITVTSVKNAFVKPQPRPWYDSRLAWFFYGFTSKTVANIAVNTAAGNAVVW